MWLIYIFFNSSQEAVLINSTCKISKAINQKICRKFSLDHINVCGKGIYTKQKGARKYSHIQI